MLNLQKLLEHYNYHEHMISGGQSFYEINSNKPISLNRTSSGFILDDKGRTQPFYFDTNGMSVRSVGLTLDKYFLHPWYPARTIIAFEVVRPVPGHVQNELLDILHDQLITETLSLSVDECLQMPEFFKPIYE